MPIAHDSDLKGSETRLWQLVHDRTQSGADVERIDQRIWDLFGESLAVMFTDLSGFSRKVAAFGIIHFLQVIYEQKRVLLPVVADHDGILIKIEADSFLIIFKSAEKALRCAVAMQQATAAYNLSRHDEEQVLLCVGLGYGRILRIGDSDVFGQEVNSACKLGEDTATAGEILLTDAARAAAANVTGVSYEILEDEVLGSSRNFRALYS